MNPHTGEVRELASTDLIPPGFMEVPRNLRSEAQRHIDNNTPVNLKAASALADWAAKQRKKQRDKAKAQKRSRRANRR